MQRREVRKYLDVERLNLHTAIASPANHSSSNFIGLLSVSTGYRNVAILREPKLAGGVRVEAKGLLRRESHIKVLDGVKI